MLHVQMLRQTERSQLLTILLAGRKFRVSGIFSQRPKRQVRKLRWGLVATAARIENNTRLPLSANGADCWRGWRRLAPQFPSWIKKCFQCQCAAWKCGWTTKTGVSGFKTGRHPNPPLLNGGSGYSGRGWVGDLLRALSPLSRVTPSVYKTA